MKKKKREPGKSFKYQIEILPCKELNKTWLEWRSTVPNFDSMPISAGIVDNKLFLNQKQKYS
jgi:hypothetical protein